MNSCVLFIIRCSAGTVNWRVDEMKALDRRTRKMLGLYCAFHKKSDVDQLYLPRKDCGRELSIEDAILAENNLSEYAF